MLNGAPPLWQQPDKQTVEVFQDDWKARARASDVSMLYKVVQAIDSHREGILSVFDFLISTRHLEGSNNEIMTLQQQACSFLSLEFFKLKI